MKLKEVIYAKYVENQAGFISQIKLLAVISERFEINIIYIRDDFNQFKG